VIELTKLKQDALDTETRRALVSWLQFFRGAPYNQWPELIAEEQHLRKVMMTLESISQDLEARLLAMSREKFVRDQFAIQKTAYEDGIAQGIAKGAEQKVREIALSMLKEGATPEFVMKVTGLPEDQLNSL
jgi:predicted transposase/invertase (TIGR01784 family)